MNSNIHRNVRRLEKIDDGFYSEMKMANIHVVNLTAKYFSNNTEDVFFRESDYLFAVTTINCKRKNNLAVFGESGVGKTAFIHYLARYVSMLLPDYTLAEVNVSSLISGCAYRGDFEKKLNSLIALAIAHNVVIYFDEAHVLSMTGGAGSGGIDAMNILKPYLTSDFRCIISTTTAESCLLMNDTAFSRRFRFVELKPLSKDLKHKIIISKFGDVPESRGYLNSVGSDDKSLFEMIDDVDFLISASKIKGLSDEIYAE